MASFMRLSLMKAEHVVLSRAAWQEIRVHPGFPVEFGGDGELRAAFLNESRTILLEHRIPRFQEIPHRLRRTPRGKRRLRPAAFDKRTSAAVKRGPFTARLKPCPSFDSLFPSLLGSVKASGAVPIGQLKNLS
jgi:hypothetical protein